MVGNIHAKFGQNPWSGSPGISFTNYGPTDGRTIQTLTSTDVENCNAGNLHALRQELLNLLNLQNLLNMHATDYSVVVYSMHANVTSCET